MDEVPEHDSTAGDSAGDPTTDLTGEVTRLLRRWGAGDRRAAAEALPLLYPELRKIAASYARRERAGHTLQATAIVHEAYMRLIDLRGIAWQDRSHFLGMAARAMRQVLVDHARDRNRLKRGSGRRPVTLVEAAELARGEPPDLVALDDALRGLEKVDSGLVQVVELRFFAGMSLEETASYLGISRATIIRRWRRARAWLFEELRADGG